MRPRSLVAPLLLIGLGTAFLISNLNPSFPMLRILAQWWPFILIGWGVLRIAEVTVWRLRGLNMPLSGLTGGEWMLAVLLCFVGSGLSAAHYGRAQWANARIGLHGLEIFGETFEYPVEMKQAVPAGARVLVENWRGNARIIAGDGNEVVVTGRKSIRAMDRAAADEAEKKVTTEIVEQGGQYVVRVQPRETTDNVRISSDLEITVPRTASIEARGRYGDYDITGIQGDVDIRSDNAGVRVQDIGGGVRVDLRRSDIVRAINVKGDVMLTGNGREVELETITGQVTVNGSFSDLQFRNIAKPLRYQSSQTELTATRVPGEVRLDLREIVGDNIVGPIRFTGRTKDVRLSNFTDAIEVSVNRGDIDLRPARAIGAMEVRTNAGDIDVALPTTAKFQLRAATSRGSIENLYGDPLRASEHGDSAALEGSVGQGPLVTLNANRGVIRIQKSETAEAFAMDEREHVKRPKSDWRLPEHPRAPEPPPPPPRREE